MVLESLERFPLAFRVDFHASILEITHPTVKPFDGRQPVDVEAEALICQ